MALWSSTVWTSHVGHQWLHWIPGEVLNHPDYRDRDMDIENYLLNEFFLLYCKI